MIKVGNFFFRYRNWIFILFYATLFLPSPELFSYTVFGDDYYVWPIVLGLFVTITGQLIRGATIGLAYIIRGGKDGKPYAEGLVTKGIFHHCRNPLYVGNILMLLGVGILANSLIYVLIMIPLFVFIYHSIVLAEENFLLAKFGESFNSYRSSVNRWIPNLSGLSDTFRSMYFNWKRWILKEYNTQFVWLSGITLILLLKYPELTDYDTYLRNRILGVVLTGLVGAYLIVRYLKKSGRMRE